MFNAILDTSESTQVRIDANAAALAEHDQRLAMLTHGLAEEAVRAAALQRQRLLWTVWPAVAATAGLSLATCARAFGWF